MIRKHKKFNRPRQSYDSARIAEENKIPLYEDPELAKLLSKIELDSEVPPELYVLVAEVLFFVYKLDRMAEKRERLLEKMREKK